MDLCDINRPPHELVKAFQAVSTPTISNALDRLHIHGVMRHLTPIVPGTRCVGPAFTVHEVTGELGSADPTALPLGDIVDRAQAGDVIVVDNGGAAVSTWGGVVTFAAKAKGIAGVVVDGGVRDADDIRKLEFPAFPRHVVPVTGKGRIRVLAINTAIRVDGVVVLPGDIIVADGSGVVCVPRQRAEEVYHLAHAQEATDRNVLAGLRNGLSLTEAMHRAGVK